MLVFLIKLIGGCVGSCRVSMLLVLWVTESCVLSEQILPSSEDSTLTSFIVGDVLQGFLSRYKHTKFRYKLKYWCQRTQRMQKNVTERKGVIQKMIKEENILLMCLFILSMGFIGIIYDQSDIIVLFAWRIELQEDSPVNPLIILRV